MCPRPSPHPPSNGFCHADDYHESLAIEKYHEKYILCTYTNLYFISEKNKYVQIYLLCTELDTDN